MLKPPSEYELTKVNLSSHPVKIDNLYFDNAVIFFTPKIVDKGVDLATLQCTIVQITDRGEWGKEETQFTIDASSFNNRKYRQFDLITDAEYSLKVIPPPELRMGILEIYFDPIIHNHSAMPTNNPAFFDPAAFTNAVATGIGVANQTKVATTSKDNAYTVKAWSGNMANHVARALNVNSLGVKIFNSGNQKIYVDLGDPANKAFGNYDEIIQPGGYYTSTDTDRTLPINLYLDPNKPDQSIFITEFYPAPQG